MTYNPRATNKDEFFSAWAEMRGEVSRWPGGDPSDVITDRTGDPSGESDHLIRPVSTLMRGAEVEKSKRKFSTKSASANQGKEIAERTLQCVITAVEWGWQEKVRCISWRRRGRGHSYTIAPIPDRGVKFDGFLLKRRKKKTKCVRKYETTPGIDMGRF